MRISLVNSIISYVGDRLENLYGYADKDGMLTEGCNAYRCGMRTVEELDELMKVFPSPNGKRQTFEVTLLQARVIRDRILFAYEIASDNASDGDRAAGRMAVYCRSAINAIDATMRGEA